MEKKIMQLFILFLLTTVPVVAQKTDRKAEKERKRVEKEKEIATLIESKNFEFRGTRAIPTGYKSVDLTTNPNFVRFSNDMINSDMPFFGRAYSVNYGGDSGLKFEGKPDVYTIEKKKKNYEIEAKVRDKNDYFTINLTVSFEGGSTMNISCNNRSAISYYGEIFAPETPDK